MRFVFSEDQRMLRDTVRDVLARKCSADALRKTWEDGTGHCAPAWRTLAETGVIGMVISEQDGGMGMNELDLVLPLEEAGYAALPGPFIETAAVAVPLLEAIGAEPVKSKWLPRITLGEALIAVGFAGQPFVPHAPIADLLLLQRGDSIFAFPRERIEMRQEVSVDRSRTLATLNWKPEQEYFIAKGVTVELELAFERAVLGTAAELIGLSRRMLDITVQYARDREQFGRPIGAQQAVKHHLADALIKQEFARPLVYRAAWSLAHREPEHQVHVSMAKIYAAEAARFCARKALQVHGAIGYTIECDLHMWMKRVWALLPAYGDSVFHRARIAKQVLEAPLPTSLSAP